MRFITEFELDYPYKLSSPEANKERAKYDMGAIIHEVFDWEELTFRGKDDVIEKKRWVLEIEAFPMKDYLAFKENIINYLSNIGVNPKVIKDRFDILESIGKPSGDTITNLK